MSLFKAAICIVCQGIFVFFQGSQTVASVSLAYNRFLGNRVNNMYASPAAHQNGAFVYGSAISNHVGLQSNTNNLNFLRSRDVAEGLCAAVPNGSGTWYAIFPGDCSKYVQCWDNNGNLQGTVRQCPFGLFWKQDELTCATSTNVRCEMDPCLSAHNEFTYRMDGSGCRAFWTCINSYSVGSCCAPGTRYVEGMGCLLGLSCNDPCPPRR
uniref:Chitin-binding type-2 domain-containing protein n=1 Tax=Magallana gigas TaxID=29159 RepID=A0A8W8L8C3_MAGGI|nr:protein PIF [Crassostrea gigas]